jgi:hypothetical protein
MLQGPSRLNIVGSRLIASWEASGEYLDEDDTEVDKLSDTEVQDYPATLYWLLPCC